MSVKTSELPELQRNDLEVDDYIPVVDTTEKILKKMKYLGISGSLMSGTSDSAASEYRKTATLIDPNYFPKIGDFFQIQFNNANTCTESNITLKLNSSSWHPIRLKNSSTSIAEGVSNIIVRWNGSFYELISTDYATGSYHSEISDKVTHNLSIYSGDGGSSFVEYQFDGSTNRQVQHISCRVTVPVSGWTNQAGSDGYYSNVVNMSTQFNTLSAPIVNLTGQNNQTVHTINQKLAYDLVDKFDFELGNNISQVTVKAKAKPTETFYIMVNGIYIA